MFKSSMHRNLISTWLLPSICAVLGLSVIAVMWLLPQVKEEGVWRDMSAQIEARIIQETRIEPASVEGSSSNQIASPTASGITQLIPKESENTAVQELDSQAQLTETKQESMPKGQVEQKDASAAQPQDVTNPAPTISSASEGLINVNQATADELTELPGIGPSKAKAIIQYREKYGPFQKMDELLEVKGIGSKILDKMRSKITLGL